MLSTKDERTKVGNGKCLHTGITLTLSTELSGLLYRLLCHTDNPPPTAHGAPFCQQSSALSVYSGKACLKTA